MTRTDVDRWRRLHYDLSEIDLSAGYIFNDAQDISDTRIVGEGRGCSFARNFVRCSFIETVITRAAFKGVDYKDSTIVNSTFEDSDLGGGSLVSCTVIGSVFDRCSFTSTAVHDCRFVECRFIECTFENAMFRNSIVSDVLFSECATSNKLFDGCRVYDCRFEATMLDASVIFDNFGIDQRQIDLGQLRRDRSRGTAGLTVEGLHSSAQSRIEREVFSRIKLAYFLGESDETVNHDFDRMFDPTEWLGAVRAPVNFERLLQDFADFILRAFDADSLESAYVLRLAQLTREISDETRDGEGLSQISQTAAAVTLECLRRLVAMETAIRRRSGGDRPPYRLIFRSYNDALDEDIEAISSEIRSLCPSAAVAITPRNSPLDILMSGLTATDSLILLTLFFSTKTRIALEQRGERAETGLKADNRAEGDARALVDFKFGAARDGDLADAVALSTGMLGRLVFKVEVKYSVSLVNKVKNAIEELIS